MENTQGMGRRERRPVKGREQTVLPVLQPPYCPVMKEKGMLYTCPDRAGEGWDCNRGCYYNDIPF